MAHKDYWGWTARKNRLNGNTRTPDFHEREIWWAAVGHNIGDEEDGKGRNFARPLVIVKKFNRSLFYGMPLSTVTKQNKYYHPLTVKGRQRSALLSHMRDYDAKRLLNRLDILSEIEYLQLVLAIFMLIKPE